MPDTREPLSASDPILSCQHVVLTPHTADQNTEGRDLLNSGAVENVLAFLFASLAVDLGSFAVAFYGRPPGRIAVADFA